MDRLERAARCLNSITDSMGPPYQRATYRPKFNIEQLGYIEILIKSDIKKVIRRRKNGQEQARAVVQKLSKNI